MDRAVQYGTEWVTSWFNSMPTYIRAIIVIVIGALAAWWYVARAIKKVEQGHISMRLRWGKVILHYDKSLSPKERDAQKAADKPFIEKGQCALYGRPRYFLAGWHQGVPEAHKWNDVDTRDRVIVLTPKNVLNKDTRSFDGCKFDSPRVIIEIVDPYLCSYKNENPMMFAEAVVDTALSVVLDSYLPSDVSASMQEINNKVVAATALDLSRVGMHVTSLQLGSKVVMSEGWTAQAIAGLKDQRILDVQ